MKRKRLFILLGSICLMMVIVVLPFMAACAKPAPPAAPAKPIVLTFHTEHPGRGFYADELFKPWFAEIEEATEGTVKIEPYWSATLVSARDAYGAVVKGLVDIANFAQAHTPGKFPMTDVMLMSTYDKVCWKPSRVLWELYQKFPEMRAQYTEVKVLGLVGGWPVSIPTTKKPIRKLEDNQGLKMWVGGKIFAMRGEALGWAPVTVMPAEFYTSLEKGVVDGGPQSLCFFWMFKTGELIKYVAMVPFIRMPLAYAMNIDKWNSLPPEIQKQIEGVSGPRLGDRHDRAEALYDREARQRAIEEFGIEFIDLPPEELARWVEVDKPVAEALIAELEAKGLPGRKLFEEYWRLEAKYSAPEYEPK